MIRTFNSFAVYLLFILFLTMGLGVDSTSVKEDVLSGNVLRLPVYMLSYAVPNWVGI